MSDQTPPLHEHTEYFMPQTFKVGSAQLTEPLVQPEQLLGHLKLLNAFSVMRQKVENGDPRFPDLVREMSAENRWAWFVSLAVERFELWCGAISNKNDILSYRLPPVDVVMVWHAYLLNPGWYIEDTMRIRMLMALSAFNEHMTMDAISIRTLLPDDPLSQRTNYWEMNTSTLYNPFDSAKSLTHKTIVCPGCVKQVKVPFLNEGGSGYAQTKFKSECPCGHLITKETLGIHKFAKNLEVFDEFSKSDTTTEKYFAGSLHHPGNVFDVARATEIGESISNVEEFKNKVTTEVVVQVKDNNNLRQYLATKLKSRLSIRIAAAYTDDRMFSIDLVGAVLRQASFIKKMVDIGWTSPTFFSSEDHSLLLVNSITKYHAFLGLMQSSPSEFFVPTLEIDLVWHTHQLTAREYQSDCRLLVGRYIDHNDKVDEGKLSDAFDSTCRAWKARYGVSYVHCGCPVPEDTIWKKLRRIISSRKNARSKHQADLDASAATHPSDHNAVHINCSSEQHKTKNKLKKSTHEKAFRPMASVHHTVDKSVGSICAVGAGICSTTSAACGSLPEPPPRPKTIIKSPSAPRTRPASRANSAPRTQPAPIKQPKPIRAYQGATIVNGIGLETAAFATTTSISGGGGGGDCGGSGGYGGGGSRVL